MEPNYSLPNMLNVAVPFGAYYVGIMIRRFAFPGDFTSTLGCQILLGIPVSLVVVSTLLMTVLPNISNVPSYLLMLGIVMEQGMVVNETVLSHLTALRKGTLPVAMPNNGVTAQ